MNAEVAIEFSSGIPALDDILQGIIAGDNVVFQIDKINNYIPFVHAFSRNANREGKNLIYLRFAQHQYLLPEGINATTYNLDPEKGFDFFLSEIITIIETHGYYACYVFDSLSYLTADWYSDAMLSNFFMITCPYLYDFKTVAFFALFRHYHESTTFNDIHSTAQVIIDVYHDKEKNLYIHPLKVVDRFSSTLFMLHKWDDLNNPDSPFKTIKESAIIAEILSARHYQWLDFSKEHRDAWHLTFQKAQETLEGLVLGEISLKESEKFKSKMLDRAIVLGEQLFSLAKDYFDLEDILSIRKRMIGTGFIGGKSLGMLLSRAILKKNNPEIAKKLEVHDSFYIGTDVFYTFLVKNKCWWMRRKLSSPETFLEGIEETSQKILKGTFPYYLIEKFSEVLNYYGQAPIIIRSSSLQEDAFGNSFSGKYESVFLTNQGPFEERLEGFINAIRLVYVSAISEDALTYRKNRGLLIDDEQMSILVQRVSGSMYGRYFFPHIAGVGYSFNPYVWDKRINPKDGFLRIVAGLGTRAVDRIENDHTRLVALTNPLLQIHSDINDIQKYSQRFVDLLDLQKNEFITGGFDEIHEVPDVLPYLNLIATRNYELEDRMRRSNRLNVFSWVLTFENLLKNTSLANDFKSLLETLEKAYQNPVDIEFTVNFFEDLSYKINLVQCRPFQIKKEIKDIEAPEHVKKDSIIIKSSGPIIGTSIATKIDRIIYVVPSIYAEMELRDRHSVARLIGKINRLDIYHEKNIMLLGPGRWGTSTPSLGVPVNFSEINHISFLCEIAEKTGQMIPDVSLGTHFFNDIVELEILYFVLHPSKEGYVLNYEFFQDHQNRLKDLLPDEGQWENVVKIIDFDKDDKWEVDVNMNALTQEGICYLSNKK